MGIEEDIKQQKFRSESQKAVLNILYTANTIIAANAKALKPYGVTPEQYNVLRILRGQFPTPASVVLIQDRMLNRMSNASRLVDKLELKLLVDRKQCPNDRRQVEILITDKGLALLKEVDVHIDNVNKRMECIDEQKLMELNALLDQIRKQL